MAILINKAILHVIDNTKMDTVISDEELDYESETSYEFINRHVKRMMNSPKCQTATFNIESEVYQDMLSYINHNIYFKELTQKLTYRLSEIMYQHTDIPPSDLLFVQFSDKDVNHLAIIKLNYNHCFLRQKAIDANGKVDNQIVRHNTVLPLTAAKVEEACIIPYDPMVIKLIEKPHLIDGDPSFYFSTLFLDCETNISKKEAVDIIEEVNDGINMKYFDDKIDTLVEFKNAIIEEAEEGEGIVRMENVARKAFGESSDIKDEYMEAIKEFGIIDDIDLGEKLVKKEFGTQRFVADNGIEIKFPSEITQEDESIIFKHHSDGTVTITLNNLRKKPKR